MLGYFINLTVESWIEKHFIKILEHWVRLSKNRKEDREGGRERGRDGMRKGDVARGGGGTGQKRKHMKHLLIKEKNYNKEYIIIPYYQA